MSFFSGFSEHYQAIFPFRNPTFEFLQSLQTGEAASVLDLGCGTGHYIGKFAEAGVKAVGLDLDSEMINYAGSQHKSVTFHTMNMLDIEQLNQKFGLVFSTGNVLAHFSERQLPAFLKSVHKVLAHEGTWAFQVVNWDFILQHKAYDFPVINLEEPGVSFYRKYIDISTSGVTFKTVLRSNEKVLFSQETRLFPIKAATFIALHEQAGLKLTGHFSDFNQTPFRADLNKANIMVFKKKS